MVKVLEKEGPSNGAHTGNGAGKTRSDKTGARSRAWPGPLLNAGLSSRRPARLTGFYYWFYEWTLTKPVIQRRGRGRLRGLDRPPDRFQATGEDRFQTTGPACRVVRRRRRRGRLEAVRGAGRPCGARGGGCGAPGRAPAGGPAWRGPARRGGCARRQGGGVPARRRVRAG